MTASRQSGLGTEAARLQATLRMRVGELRAATVPLVQIAAAAGIAWAVAHDVLGHPRPFFAPIAATIVLGIAPGRRVRRAVEMVIGVAVGIAVGDLLIALIGSGAVQIALIVLLAMAAAILLGGGPLVASQAASSAVLVAALPSGQAIPSRFVDALVGGFVGLAVLAVVPRNPLTMLRRATAPLFTELASVLDAVADALASHDPAGAGRALDRARGASDLATRFRQTLDQAEDTVRLAPTYWRSRGDVQRYVEAAPHIDYAVRNIRVLARAARTAVEGDDEIPAALPAAVRDLGSGVRALTSELERGRGAADGIADVLRAAGRATLVLDESPSLAATVVIGQIRSTSVDLLRALGVDRTDAVRYVRSAAKRFQLERGADALPSPGA